MVHQVTAEKLWKSVSYKVDRKKRETISQVATSSKSENDMVATTPQKAVFGVLVLHQHLDADFKTEQNEHTSES